MKTITKKTSVHHFPYLKVFVFLNWKLFICTSIVWNRKQNKNPAALTTLLLHVAYHKEHYSCTPSQLFNTIAGKKVPWYQIIKKLLQTSWSFIWMFYNLKKCCISSVTKVNRKHANSFGVQKYSSTTQNLRASQNFFQIYIFSRNTKLVTFSRGC